MLRPRSTGDLVAGLIFVGLGAAFAIGALGYDLGSLLEMGPGYVPLVLGLVLAALGVAIVVKAYVAPDPAPGEVSDAAGSGRAVPDAEVPDGGAPDTEVPDAAASDGVASDRVPTDADVPDPRPLAGIQWRPTVAIFAAVGFFALTVDGLGLLPATFGTGLLAAMARPGTRVLRALLIAVGLTLTSWIIFAVLLQLRLALFGDWLGG
ncbi:tripartite tricarboxylate transporter TctB family protein [Promicromonospora sp. AC04]|uniref:tripartite tricarboxylate transporter TctB family protein n=1 Tax=Promicromonospora sp. AC04 TaxID=2135723 RepID=UPI000D34DC0C|nr:tripartite tricarboxylate transporter TctB family protein [Promicromonospora sp. AC04]PUB24379.1 tripartite tricarboxylate transporter TctB family protein [Promicromonospora sp. AC04]